MTRNRLRFILEDRLQVIVALVAVAVVAATLGAALVVLTRPAAPSAGSLDVKAAPVDLAVPLDLSPSQLGHWCVDRRAAGTRGLSARARNWLADCIELFGGGLTPSTSSPSPSPSPTPSPSPSTSSPSPTPTPSPSPTVSPSPTGRACAPFPAMPDVACTGVPVGVVLHECASEIRAPGVYDSCLWSGGLQIMSRGVTITRSRVLGIVGDGGITFGENSQRDPDRNLRLVDVEIDGGTAIDPDGLAAIGQDGWSCLRCYVHHTGRGANAGTNVSIEDSLFVNFGSVGPAHVTAVGSNGGQHSRIVHNSLTCNVVAGREGGCSAAFSLYGDFAPIDDWYVAQNSFASPQHGFCTYAGSLPKPYPNATNVRYIDNRFGPCPQYGAVSGWAWNAGNVWIGNTWQDGTPILV